jgi:hypothetical protein
MRLAPLLLLLALAACYETPQPACAFACGGDGDCPGGYSCRADSWCKRSDLPDDTVCTPPQAGGTESDASPGGSPDASEGVDAAADGGAADAALSDAAPADAPPSDAAPDAAPPPDAPTADAAPISISIPGS